MKENKIQELLNNIDYDTYKIISRVLGISTIGTSISANTIFTNHKTLNNSLEALSVILFITYYYFYFTKNKYETKDIKEIKIIYKEFLNNYNNLNKTFDFKDPIEIYTMYNFLLYKGYLSINKKFDFTNKAARDITLLLGTNIITGKGVCRHIAPLLTDILNTNNISACNLNCYIKNNIININVLDEEKYTREELNEDLIKHNIRNEIYDTINNALDKIYQNNKFAEFSYTTIDSKNIFAKKFGNHAICFAHKDQFNYYLDPTQFSIYRLKDKKTLCDIENNDIKLKIDLFLNDK